MTTTQGIGTLAVTILAVIFGGWLADEVKAIVEDDPAAPAEALAFILRVAPEEICHDWKATSCTDAAGELPRCVFTMVTSPALEDVLCLGAGCAKLFDDTHLFTETSTIVLRGSVAKFCGEPGP